MTTRETTKAELRLKQNHALRDFVNRELDKLCAKYDEPTEAQMETECQRFFRLGLVAGSAITLNKCFLCSREQATDDGICQTCHGELSRDHE